MSSFRFTAELVCQMKGAKLAILVLLTTNTLGVSNEWLARNANYTDKPISQALAYLEEHGYVMLTASGWKLAGAERQLPLGALPDVVSDASDPAPLQAGVPLDDAPDITSGRNYSDSSVVIVLKESVRDSINNNNNDRPGRKNSDQARRRGAAHIAQVAAALLKKGQPAAAADDPLSADLRVCAERLVAVLHVNRKRAELAVARSPWLAPQILEQAAIWAVYPHSPYGKTLDPGKFPWLVAARIEAGEPCPFDFRAGDAGDNRYDGYLEFMEADDKEEKQ